MKQMFLERSEENISAAEELFNSQRYNASANRSYYAAFHAAIAALLHFGYTVEIDHKPVQAAFAGMLIHGRKLFPATMKSMLLELHTVRAEADYRAGIGKKRSAAQLKQAQFFVSTVLNTIV